jgi:RHH-type proline utilization regulon transcriptional repressor/proline dehydrogenase/delta 1-pyrroline-5-carboxylate dehydrogenase
MDEVGRVESDPSGLAAERNVFRYRPLPGGVALRAGWGTSDRALDLARRAAEATSCRLVVSHVDTEDEPSFGARLSRLGVDRVRLLGEVGDGVRRASHDAAIPVDEAEPVSDPALELPRWLQEQSLSITTHRHGLLRPPPPASETSSSRA